MDKLFSALSLCRKAGRLTAGFDAVADAVLQGEAALVLTAQDTSPGTQKRIRTVAEGLCPVRALPFSQAELATITRKAAGVLAVTDQDLAGLCLRAMPNEEEPA